MGTRVLKFILNTPALVAWGKKPTTGQLSGLTYKMATQEGKLLYNRQQINDLVHYKGQHDWHSWKYNVLGA